MKINLPFKKEKKDIYIRSNSQCGEDIIVNYIFNLRGIQTPSYIDIGANDPYFLSNTALFYNKGSRGINIEPNPCLIPKFLKYRSQDINLNLGIGPSESIVNFYVLNDPTLSSFSLKECEKYYATGKYFLEKTIKVQVTTIIKILEEYCDGIFPDFLSIDTEGMDLDILKTINFEVMSPKVICVEAAEYSPIGAGERRNELIDFLSEKGYFEYANTNLNAIMVRKDFWFI